MANRSLSPSLPLLSAHSVGGSTAATLVLLRAVGIRWTADDPTTPLDLLDLLRSAEVNPSVRGTQDHLLGQDDVDPTGTIQELASRPEPIQVIAEENQWLWQAHVADGPDGQPVARIIDEEADEHIGDLGLGDFLLRMVATNVTSARSATREHLRGRPVGAVDPDRFVGPDQVRLPRVHLANLGLGDGWFLTSWTDPRSGSIWTTTGPGEAAALETGRAALRGRWTDRPTDDATSPDQEPER